MDDSILREAERNVRHYWRLVLTLGVPAVMGFVGALIVLLLGHPFTPGLGALMAAALVCYGVCFRLARPHMPGSMVLWIRRFQQGERAQHLQVLLEFAAMGSGGFITLADDDVVSESGDRFTASRSFATLVGLAFTVIVFSEGSPLWVVTPVVGFLWYGMERLHAALRRRRKLTPRNMERKLGKSLRAARWRQGARTVFRAPREGDLWLGAIGFLADRVDAVVVFAEERSPAVDREIEVLLDAGRLSARNFVLLHSGPAPDSLISMHPALANAWSFRLPSKTRAHTLWPYTRTGRELSYLIRAAVMSRA